MRSINQLVFVTDLIVASRTVQGSDNDSVASPSKIICAYLFLFLIYFILFIRQQT